MAEVSLNQRKRLDMAQSVLGRYCAEAGSQDAQALVARAREEADRLVGRGSELAETTFAAGVLASLVAEGHIPHGAIATVAEELHEHADANLLAVGLRALHDPRLILLPLEEFLDATLALLEALGPLHAPSIWIPGDQAAGPRLLRWRSEVPSWAVPELARVVLAEASMATEGVWTAVGVRSFQRPSAALAFRVDEDGAQPAAALAASFGRLLSRAFERASLFATSAEQSAALVKSSERRVTRVGLDLHDGPLQDVALLSGELAGLRAALGSEGPKAPTRDALKTCVDDLMALVSHLDDELREVANSLYAVGAMRRPFAQTLSGIVRAFGVRSGIEPDVRVTGDIDALSESQRSALLRVVQECLSNAREHSKAKKVCIAITAGPTQVDAIIEDDGVGFDVERALRDAARRGRMGLLGIVERVRLLGGFCDIDSRPGEGCRVTLTVARWTPEMAATKGAETGTSVS
ncbi:MAG: hypothetical protein M3417_01830 [Actinomycetota bacterium]|nr:hypothetical protein [Actinomycetota bacterium]